MTNRTTVVCKCIQTGYKIEMSFETATNDKESEAINMAKICRPDCDEFTIKETKCPSKK